MTEAADGLAFSGRQVELAGEGSELAAVDLGSNSFHMIVARVVKGELQVVDKRREMVRLAAGLNDDNRLERDARDRALACLQRFGQRVAALPEGAVRAVGTNTLRKAKDSRSFIREAEAALGYPIQIIANRLGWPPLRQVLEIRFLCRTSAKMTRK